MGFAGKGGVRRPPSFPDEATGLFRNRIEPQLRQPQPVILEVPEKVLESITKEGHDRAVREDHRRELVGHVLKLRLSLVSSENHIPARANDNVVRRVVWRIIVIRRAERDSRAAAGL